MQSQPEKPSFWQIIISTLAAAFGVQKRENLERDTKQGNAYVYIAAGILFTVIFVLTVILVVQTVLKNSGM